MKVGERVAEPKKRNQYEYDKKAYDHVHLQVPKGKKDIIKNHATEHGESVNGFVNRAIDETIKRDTGEDKGA